MNKYANGFGHVQPFATMVKSQWWPVALKMIAK
jgi:hypothetical protein